MFKLVLEKAEEPEITLPTSAGSWKKQESSRKTCFCFIDYAKAFDCVDHNKLWKILKQMGIPDPSSANRGDNEKNQAERGGFHCFPLLLSWEDLKGTAKKKI